MSKPVVLWADETSVLWRQPALPVLVAKLQMRTPPFEWERQLDTFVLNAWEVGAAVVQRWLMEVKLVPTADGAKIVRVKEYPTDIHLVAPDSVKEMAASAQSKLPQLDSCYWAVTKPQGARVPLIDLSSSAHDSPAYAGFKRSELAAHRTICLSREPQIVVMR